MPSLWSASGEKAAHGPILSYSCLTATTAGAARPTGLDRLTPDSAAGQGDGRTRSARSQTRQASGKAQPETRTLTAIAPPGARFRRLGYNLAPLRHG